jgi:hypothetical protein
MEETSTMKTKTSYVDKRECLDVNIPELFKRPDFQAWLDKEAREFNLATWHQPGSKIRYRYSDTWMFIELEKTDKGKGPGEGSNSDMPEACWILLGDFILENFGPWQGMIRLTGFE